MADRRPDPDELLSHVKDVEEQARRGKLTIFFGAAPGVGKTYAMLEAARVETGDGVRDVLVGIVETHGRYDTASALIGLELLPRRTIVHQGIKLEELDLDAALERRPHVILVDELAHTNAPGSRHTKRWQDVEELLDAGIDVFTTLNVQHLESLNDVVAQITGVVVRETVPDAVFERAYDVRLIDLPVGELLQRLLEGKVYVPERAARAMENFFKEGNLIALRQLALRRTSDRVDAKIRNYRAAHGIDAPWHTGERILVCISPSPHSVRLVRAAKRMASSLQASLIGLYVETPAAIRMTPAARERLATNVRLLESLGGEPVTVRGENAAIETVRYARKRNVTKIVVGKPTHSRWRDVVRGSFLDDVVRRSREVDVYVISGEAEEPTVVRGKDERPPRTVAVAPYAAGVVVVAAATLVSWLMFGQKELADIVMVMLSGIVVVAMRFGYGPSLVATVLTCLAFDFFFIPPYLTFVVSDLRHIATFAVMFVVGVVVSHLTQRIRDQANSARQRERRTASLYAVTREVGLAQSRDALLDAAARHLREVFHANIAVHLPASDGSLAMALADEGTFAPGGQDVGIALWVWTNQKRAGRGTDTLPSAGALVVPLTGSRGRVGVLSLFPSAGARLDDADERQLLETFAGIIASALERTSLADEARDARLRVETEQLRNALLSSVSHDFRTPLGVVTGATSALLDEETPVDDSTRRELLQTAHEEALRLSRLVRDLLDMTRLEAGALKVKTGPLSIEELVGSALARTSDRLAGRDVRTNVPEDLLAFCDSALVEQVLINLLENATKYSPPGSPIEIAAKAEGDVVTIEVSDRGPGIEAAYAERVFEKFYRVHEGEGGGVGLGLTICRGIVEAHGGTIGVRSRSAGGATFHFTLPRAPASSLGEVQGKAS
ncbi:Osmosensitive K+ channel histidine kinase KdpD [Labilithrix luteola]|uniref:histidine kinase n=1 Tax=Labilithrix luteola TaxID=1391654 RepID=A0A0K1PWA5_9BACT|nr:sensor histidine kinase KdpD [Labilithrix luteola]AKU97797.1 Osmosensitive K+ channel histidine kinase KdpD [Labilithrix luteola]